VLVSTEQRRPEVSLLLLATLLLASCILVYALDRGGAVYFLPDWAVGPNRPAIFGTLGDHLPTFLHPIAFILITAAVLRPWPRLLPAICAAWFVIECLFELGQMPPFDSRIAAAVPPWFDSTPILQIAADYFTRGTYDPLDVLSIGLGTVIAYPIVRILFEETHDDQAA